MNIDLAWQSPAVDFDVIEPWLEDLASFEPSLVRLFPTDHTDVSNPWHYWDADPSAGNALERNYQQFGERLDRMLNRCADIGARAMVILFGCGGSAMREPYRGVARSSLEFFTSSVVRSALKDRFADMVRPFRTDPRIFAWQLFNEPNQAIPETPDGAAAYGALVAELASHLLDHCRVTQLVSDGMAADAVVRFCAQSDFRYVDLLDKHHYGRGGDDPNLERFTAMLEWIYREMRANDFPKPLILAEVGQESLADDDKAGWFSAMLSICRAKEVPVLPWGLWGTATHALTVNPRWMRRTADAIRRHNRRWR